MMLAGGGFCPQGEDGCRNICSDTALQLHAVWSRDVQLKSPLETDNCNACISFSVSVKDGDWQDLTDSSAIISSAFWSNPSLIPSLIPECSVWLTQVLGTQ